MPGFSSGSGSGSGSGGGSALSGGGARAEADVQDAAEDTRNGGPAICRGSSEPQRRAAAPSDERGIDDPDTAPPAVGGSAGGAARRGALCHASASAGTCIAQSVAVASRRVAWQPARRPVEPSPPLQPVAPAPAPAPAAQTFGRHASSVAFAASARRRSNSCKPLAATCGLSLVDRAASHSPRPTTAPSPRPRPAPRRPRRSPPAATPHRRATLTAARSHISIAVPRPVAARTSCKSSCRPPWTGPSFRPAASEPHPVSPDGNQSSSSGSALLTCVKLSVTAGAGT